LAGERIQRLVISPRGRVVSQQALYRGRFGRIRAVVEGPGGFIYALTSNQDGRGSPSGQDDRVVRFLPPRR
jgi:glucose/arabinose dehydrogenase